MLIVRKSTPRDAARVVQIWRGAVDATHDFLTAADRAAIDDEVRNFLPSASLWLACDHRNRAVGFLGISGNHMDSLFIDPACRGTGVGRSLVRHAIALHPILTTDVNEQNEQAMGFYRWLGFVPTGRSPTDDQGRPYPLVHLKLDTTAGLSV
jgi:putative acetyltransferase